MSPRAGLGFVYCARRALVLAGFHPHSLLTSLSEQNEDTPADQTEEGDSSLHADQASVNMDDDDQIVTRVTQHFIAPEIPVVASREHSNSIHESNKDGVKAYAKIAAQDWTFYVTNLIVNIGRSSEPAQRRAEPDGAKTDIREDPTAVHIDLGPSKVISRQHASIYFNSNESRWCLQVKGRNALKVNGTPWRANDTDPLNSGDVIEVGGVEMMFVLPAELSALTIAPQYMERASIPRVTSAEASRPARHPLPSGDNHGSHSSPQSKASRSQSSQQRSLAPAPPDYKRPGTPPSSSARARATPAHRSPHTEPPSGPMLMSNTDVDLSADENRHIKPQYSYAQMITQAIISTDEEKLNLAGIYNFILSRYSYYRNQAPNGWQVSYSQNSPMAP